MSGKRARGQGLGEEHRHLPRAGHLAGAAGGEQVGHPQVVVVGDLAQDLVDRDLALGGAQDVGEALLGHVEVDGAADEARVGEEPVERAFEHAHVRADAVGEELHDAGADHDARVLLQLRLGLGLQDAEAELVVGRVQVDDEAPLQPRADALLEAVDLARRAVGGDDDLLLLLDQRVEGVEELLLASSPCRR